MAVDCLPITVFPDDMSGIFPFPSKPMKTPPLHAST